MRITKGSPTQFLNAVKNKIAELEGDVESAQAIKCDTNSIINRLYQSWGDGDIESFRDELTDNYNNDVAQGAYTGSFDEWLVDYEAEGQDVGYIDNQIESCDVVMSSDMYEDCDGCLVGPGAKISRTDLENMWNSNHEGDPSMVQYSSFDEWLQDSQDNGFIKPIDSACNSANIMADFEKAPESEYTTYDVVEADDDINDVQTIDEDEVEPVMGSEAEYIDKLKNKIKEEITDSGNLIADKLDSIEFKDDNNALYITVTTNDGVDINITDYEVPLADLGFNNIEADLDYILEYINDNHK